MIVRNFYLFVYILLSFVFTNIHESVTINIVDQNDNYVILEYFINDYEIERLDVKHELYHEIKLKDEPSFITKYSPQLPHINRSFIIPDLSSMNVEILDFQIEEHDGINIIPSKGNPTRNIDIKKIPYVKGSIYNTDDYFPGDLYTLHDPYILRDYRGQVLQINPFQYSPLSKKLQVYNYLLVKVEFDGQNFINAYNNNRRISIVKDYHYIYSNRFINYSSYETRYNPIEEDGEMLIICYDSFCEEMTDFVNWKNQKGLKTTLVPKSDAGTSANSIKNYIENFYSSHNLTYLLLVGDKSQIPTFEVGSGWSDGESDISYAYISGNDSYPEFFVGRFSAQNTGHVQTQVERSIEYERDASFLSTWYENGLMIASNEGAGAGHDGGESDWQHARNMRDDLLNYNYNEIQELYDGSHGGEDPNGNPSDTMVRDAINSGLGIIHYTGHGETSSWTTSNFNTSDVNALTNTNILPFICTVGCKSGDFGSTCLGETFTFATSGGEPTGAIATFMSTVYQAWAPPMEAQDEMVDILIESFNNNRKYTFGGISWNGCLEMNDNYGSDGDDETDHWTLFGDPSIELRTNAPSILSITHSGAIDALDDAYEVIINGDYDNVKAALSYNGMFLGSALEDNGSAVIILEDEFDSYEEITLTVTGYNTTTIIENVVVADNACPGVVEGDLNEDSIANIQDVIILVNIVIELVEPNDCQLVYSDVNMDGITNILDVVLVVNLILGN